MTTAYDQKINQLKGEVLKLLAQCPPADELAARFIQLVSPESITTNEDGTTAFSFSRSSKHYTTFSLLSTAVLLDLVQQASDAGISIMQYSSNNNTNTTRGAVTCMFDAFLWLSRQSSDLSFMALHVLLCAEELCDMVTGEETRGVLDYLSHHAAELKTETVDGSKGSTTLIKTCNLLLKRLSKSQHTLLCGQIHLVLAQILPLTAVSGLNPFAHFNTENVTLLEDEIPEEEEEDKAADDADTAEEATNEEDEAAKAAAAKEAKQAKIAAERARVIKKRDASFYKTFWGLQKYFSNPILALSRFENVKVGIELVLLEFNRQQISVKESRPTEDSNSSVKYLSSRELLPLQVKDAVFRRHFLIQCLVLLQWCETPRLGKKGNKLPDKLPTIKPEDIKLLRKKVYDQLSQTEEKGPAFAAAIRHLLTVEDGWSQWKEQGCDTQKNFAIPPAHPPANIKQGPIVNSDEYPNKRPKLSSECIYGIRVGTAELDRLWNITEDNVSTLGADDRGGFKNVEQLMEPIIEEIIEPPEEDAMKVSQNQMYSWKTSRLIARENLKAFAEAVKAGGDLEVAAYVMYPDRLPERKKPEKPAPVATEEPAAAGAKEGEEANAATTEPKQEEATEEPAVTAAAEEEEADDAMMKTEDDEANDDVSQQDNEDNEEDALQMDVDNNNDSTVHEEAQLEAASTDEEGEIDDDGGDEFNVDDI